MPIKATTAQERTVEITILHQQDCIREPNKRKKVFGDGEDICHEFFKERDVWGKFSLAPIQAIRGSHERQGVHIGILDLERNRFKLTLQPGSNDTAWEYWVRPPEGCDISVIHQKLKAKEGEPAKAYTMEELQVQPEVAQITGGPDTAFETPDQDQSIVLSPVAFVEDLTLVAVACMDLFPTPESTPCVSDTREILMDAMKWTSELAQQALTALVNRKHLSLLNNGASRYQLVSKELKDAFVAYGAHMPKLAPKAEPRPAPCASEPLKVGMRIPPTTDNVRHLRPRADVSASKVMQTPIKATAVAPAPEAQSSVSNNLETLERLAAEHTQARIAVLHFSGRKEALEKRRARFKAELDRIDIEMSELEAGRTEAFTTLTSEAHMQAAGKLAQIRAILQG